MKTYFHIPDGKQWAKSIFENRATVLLVFCLMVSGITPLRVQGQCDATATPNPICLGASTQLNVTTTGSNTYVWASSPSGFSSTLKNPNATPLLSTKYYVTVTPVPIGPVCIDSVSVIVNPNPTPVITGPSSYCELTGGAQYSTPNSGNTFSWNVTNGTITTGQGTNQISVNWGAAGSNRTVTVTESNSSPGCTAQATKIVTIIQSKKTTAPNKIPPRILSIK